MSTHRVAPAAQAVRVKICGITRIEDAELAIELGADALGFNFWPRSRRYCDPAVAQRIVRELPPLAGAVAVFVNQPRPKVQRICEQIGATAVQLHGDESPEFCESLSLPVIKAIRVRGADCLAVCANYRVSAFLMDAPSTGFGGSGRTFPWRVLASRTDPRPILLAGGLTPENVGRAIREVRPYAVDVATGVETAPGVKSPKKMARFIAAAKRALLETRP